MPDFWPHYDVLAQPVDRAPQRISVKSRTFKAGPVYVGYYEQDKFDWLAVVLLPGNGLEKRQYFVVPRHEADLKARRDNPTAKTHDERYFRVDEMLKKFPEYEGNFLLKA